MIEEMDASTVADVLQHEIVGRIGMAVDGRVMVVPVSYAYEAPFIYGHGAEGEKVRMMRANPRVCFEVDHLDDLSTWRSVIAHGRFEELVGVDAIPALERLRDRFAPLVVSESARVPEHVSDALAHHPDAKLNDAELPDPRVPATHTRSGAMVVYRIRLDEATGRMEHR